ncbi:hypothetical protein BAUCODRAFT_34822 [Baudoinia panamericana UAMH 10762]|uniref:Phosphoglucomutase n=1 Tax=Baudoinia panamericana (strain UAMH 10762) TaxID=717646 RepID=M2NB35_BAUPA|nr:uncharacterized protein BAUCODRAFT_34822 [Baudoinia panamericana UAMH 10762]EMC96055.1 hypothetical protein BAUCODRAFT_34822 [Baudoinia panamericana UAMH 10762]
MAVSEPIRNVAARWMDLDRDEDTRQQIVNLLEAGDDVELEKRLRKRIAFGTAGLRSSMKAGFAHMNAVTVLQASQGLADHLINYHQPVQEWKLSVVIGYDARHQSEKFARLAAGAFLAKGLRVLWFGELVHTPLVPFSVSRFNAAAGIMVTASHNPKADNGYKVYWENGCQIIPPHDSAIAAAITASEQEQILSWDEHAVDESSHVHNVHLAARSQYFDSLVRLLPPLQQGEADPVRFVYTPLHGVGLPFMQQAVDNLRLPSQTMHVVAAQAQPNAEFPTVPFPNPEEKDALDLAIQEAETSGVSVILANDPDADRFAAAERLNSGSWHQFTGNQMGILLALYVLEISEQPREKVVMLASAVSSRMLAAVAAKEGFAYRETLTGFKWLGNVAQLAAREGLTPVFAFEEAIGYMFADLVWDKDGIAAATVFLLACRSWRQQGLTPWLKLQQLYGKYGYFADANTYLISPSPDVTNSTFAAIRAAKNDGPPSHVGKRRILRWRDLTLGVDSASSDGKPDLPVDSAAQMITCWLEDNVVFTARGSGTEPKIKLYIEASASDAGLAKAIADKVLHDLVNTWFHGLRLAGSG